MGSNCCKGDASRPIRKNSSIYSRSRAGASLDDRFTVTDDASGVRLTVSAANTGDSGVYTLQACNAAGSDTTRVRLEVSADEAPTGDDPPTFLRRLQDLTVKVGTRTRFLVEILSSTECKVTWYRNERRLLEAERVSLARDGNFWCADVATVSVDDAGRWTCTAENVGGRASCSAHLNVLVPKAYKRPEFVEELRALLTEQGTVSLECKVVGVPTPVLRWFKDSCEIKAGDVFALTANAEDPTSLGTYTCEAVNCMGRAYSSSKVHVVGRGSREGSARPSSSSLTPEPPPIFTRELEDQFVRICEHLTLSCHLVVPPWPRSVVWYNKEGKVEPNERYHVLEDGAGGYLIEIPSAEWPDEGEWKCVATSSAGRVGISTCYVTMDVPKNYRKPRFMENLQAVLTEEGLVSFECKVVGFPTPVLSWFKDGQELKPGDVYQLTGTNSLGSYCCIARNCMGQASSSAELTVEDIQNQLNEEEKLQLFSKNQAPKFVQGLKSVEAKIDEPFRFTIKVAIPPEPSVLWYRDDQPVDESNRCHLGKEERGVFYLDIQSLEFLDQSEWKCVAMNDFGQSVTSCFLKLLIPRHYKKPRFLENLQAILSEEGAVNLECKVIGVPQPVLKWYKDGEELKPGDIHRIISGQDGTCCLGTYTCEAQNCMGIAASSASLLGFDDSMKAKKKKADEQILQRNLSLSTIHEERTSQMYDTPVGDITTVDDKGEISFSFDGKEVSVSLYETPDLTEEEALQIVEMYADQLSENITEHNVVELPPLRFVKETSTSGNLLMEAVIIDVSPEYFVSPEEDLRTEADVEDISIAEENGLPQLSLDQDIDNGSENYLEKTMALLSEEKSDIPLRLSRKKSDSQKSADDFFSLSREQSLSEDKKDDDTQIVSESDMQSFASAHSSDKPKSKSLKTFGEDGQELSEPTKTVVVKDEAQKYSLEPELTIIKPKRERRSSRSSRRSSSESEKSLIKAKEESVQSSNETKIQDDTAKDIEKPFKSEFTKSKLSNEEFIDKMASISGLLSKVMNDVQIIERDIILKSESMSSAATASRSLEIISSLISPLSEIHSIADAARESALESTQLSSTLFNSLPRPFKSLQQAMNLIEKCIDMESDSKTLVMKTCVAFIETCGPEVQKVISEINSVTSKDYLLTDETVISDINSLTKEMVTVIKFSTDTIMARNLLSEASEIKVEEPSLEAKHLRDTQKAVFELKTPLNALLCIAEGAESGKSVDTTKVRNSDVVLNDMSRSIQDLQTALDQVESLSVKEHNSSLNQYNTEIIETVMDSVVKLRSSFEQLSTTAKNEDNALMKHAVTAIKQNLNEISSRLDTIERNIGQFDVLQSDNKLDTLQKMAQILIALENNLPRLEAMPEVKDHMTIFHKNLTKVLENVIESNEAKKYFILMEICDAVNRINGLIKHLDVENVLPLASLSNMLRVIQDNFIQFVFESELNCSILTNITDTLIGIQEVINSAEEKSISMDSEQIQDFSIKKYNKMKAKIVVDHINQAIAAIENVKAPETTKEFNFITPTLENISPILDDLKRSVASLKVIRLEDEHLSDLSEVSYAHTFATPIYNLNQNIIILNQQIVENIESIKESSEVLPTIAETLNELHNTLEILQQEIIYHIGEDLKPTEISINLASAVQNLHSCIIIIQEQAGIEIADEISTLEDVSGIKTTADIISFDRLVLPTAEETAAQQVVSPYNQEFPHAATAQALHILNDNIIMLQLPEIIDALDTLSEVSDYSSLKSIAVELGELHSGIEEILHPIILEGSNEIVNVINPAKLTAIVEPMQELQQCLSVLDKNNIPIYENILELPADKIHSVIWRVSEFKEHLTKCMLAVFPAIETTDSTIKIANNVGALRDVCEHLKDFIETMKVPKDVQIPDKVKALELTVESLLDVTDISKSINIEQVKSLTEELFEKIITVQEEIIQFTPQSPEILAQEAKLIETMEHVENSIAVLEQYDFVDFSQVSDLTCTSQHNAAELDSQSLIHIGAIVENAVIVVKDSAKDSPVADLMIVEDFFKTCKNKFTILRYLITKPNSHKKVIRLIQEFNSLQNTINSFTKRRFELNLPGDVNGCIANFLIHADECLQTAQTSLITIVESQSEILVKAPMENIEKSREVFKKIIENKNDVFLNKTLNKFVEVIEVAQSSLRNIQLDVLDELKSPDSSQPKAEESFLLDKMEELVACIDKAKTHATDVKTQDLLDKISTSIDKHLDFKDASGTGKILIILKCLSDCIDVIQESILEVQVPKQKVEEATLKIVLSEMLEPLQVMHSQISHIQEQIALGVDEDSISINVSTTESLVQTMTEKHKKIVQQIATEHAVANEDMHLIMAVDKEIHSIQNELRPLGNIKAVHLVKDIVKPIEEIEKSLLTILSSDNIGVCSKEKLLKDINSNMDSLEKALERFVNIDIELLIASGSFGDVDICQSIQIATELKSLLNLTIEELLSPKVIEMKNEKVKFLQKILSKIDWPNNEINFEEKDQLENEKNKSILLTTYQLLAELNKVVEPMDRDETMQEGNPGAILDHIDQYIELIEIVEEISAIIKIGNIQETVEIAKELRESIAASECSTEEEVNEEKAGKIRLEQTQLAQRLQKAISALHVQFLDSAQELAPSLSAEVMQRIARVTAQLQADLIAVTEVYIAIQAPTETSQEITNTIDPFKNRIADNCKCDIQLTREDASQKNVAESVEVSTLQSTESISQNEILEFYQAQNVLDGYVALNKAETILVDTTKSQDIESISDNKAQELIHEKNIDIENADTILIESVENRFAEVVATDKANSDIQEALQVAVIEQNITSGTVSYNKENVKIIGFETVCHTIPELETRLVKEIPKVVTFDKLIQHMEEYISQDCVEAINELSTTLDIEELKLSVDKAIELRENIAVSGINQAETSDVLKGELVALQAQLAHHLQTALTALENVALDSTLELFSSKTEALVQVTKAAEILRADLVAVIIQQTLEQVPQLKGSMAVVADSNTASALIVTESDEKVSMDKPSTSTVPVEPQVHLADSIISSGTMSYDQNEAEASPKLSERHISIQQDVPVREEGGQSHETMGVLKNITEPASLLQHIEDFISPEITEIIEKISVITNSIELKNSLIMAKVLKESILTQETVLVEEIYPMIAETEKIQGKLVQNLQDALSTLHIKTLESSKEIEPEIKFEILQKVSEIITHLQEDLETATATSLPEVKSSATVQLPVAGEEDSMKQLRKLLEDVTDKINSTANKNTDDPEGLKDALDEVQTVIIKLKRDYDIANDTLNETLEDLECSVRSVQLQIYEGSPPELLKEACATLQLLVNNMSEIQEVNICEPVRPEFQVENILAMCSSETDETLKLLEIASKVYIQDSSLSDIVNRLNILKDNIKLLRLNFMDNADILIEKGIDVTQNLIQLEDKVFSLEKDLSEANLGVQERDSILTAIHSVYGSISNMRGTICSIQKQYMFENYGKPSEILLHSIKNITEIANIHIENNSNWKVFSKSLRKVLAHFEDVKFYINLDKTARLPSDAAFTKIILDELKSNIVEIIIPEVCKISIEMNKIVQDSLNLVTQILVDIEMKTAMEVKEKIPIFKKIATQMLELTDFIKTEISNNFSMLPKDEMMEFPEQIMTIKLTEGIDISDEKIGPESQNSTVNVFNLSEVKKMESKDEIVLSISIVKYKEDTRYLTPDKPKVAEIILMNVDAEEDKDIIKSEISKIAKLAVDDIIAEAEGRVEYFTDILSFEDNASNVQETQIVAELNFDKPNTSKEASSKIVDIIPDPQTPFTVEYSNIEQVKKSQNSNEQVTQEIKIEEDEPKINFELSAHESSEKQATEFKEDIKYEEIQIIGAIETTVQSDIETNISDNQETVGNKTIENLEMNIKKENQEDQDIDKIKERDEESTVTSEKNDEKEDNYMELRTKIENEEDSAHMIDNEQNRINKENESQEQKTKYLKEDMGIPAKKALEELHELKASNEDDQEERAPNEKEEFKTELVDDEEEEDAETQKNNEEKDIKDQGVKLMNEKQDKEIDAKSVKQEQDAKSKKPNEEKEAKSVKYMKEQEDKEKQENKIYKEEKANIEKENNEDVAKEKKKEKEDQSANVELEKVEQKAGADRIEKEHEVKVKTEQEEREAKLKEEMKEQEAKNENEKQGAEVYIEKVQQEGKAMKEKEQQDVNAKKKKEHDTKVKKDQEDLEAKLKEEKEEIEAKTNNEKQKHEAEAKKEKELLSSKIKKDQEKLKAKLKEEQEDKEVEAKKEKGQQEAKEKKEKELELKVKKDQEKLVVKLKEEMKELEAKNEKEKQEAKKENELQEASAKKEKAEKEAIKKDQEDFEAKLKDEKKNQEAKDEKEKQEAEANGAKEEQKGKVKKDHEELEVKLSEEQEHMAKNVNEKQEAVAKKEKEKQEAKAKKEKEDQDENIKKDQEELEAKLKDEKEFQEVNKEKELQEAKAKKEKGEHGAKIKKDQDGLQAKLTEVKEDLEAKTKSEILKQEAETTKKKEQQAAKARKEKEEHEAKVKKDREKLQAKLKEEQEEKEARTKNEKEKLEAEAKKEKEQKKASAMKEKEEHGAKIKEDRESIETKLKEEKEVQEAEAKKEKDNQEVEAKNEKEQQEAKAKKEKEREAKVKKDQEGLETKLKEEKEVQETKAKIEKEKQDAEVKNEKEHKESYAKKKNEEQEAKVEKDQEDLKAKSKDEKKDQEMTVKNENEKQEAEVKNEKEHKESYAKKKKEEQETKVKNDPEDLKAILKVEKEEIEANTKNEKEKQEADAKKEKELQEVMAIKEKDEKETKMKKDQEKLKVQLKEEQEDQETDAKKENERQEANAKKEKEEQGAKIKKDLKGLGTKLKEEKENLENEAKKEKEQQEATAKKEKEEQEAKIKKDQEGLETKLKEEKEDLEAKDKNEKEEEDAKVKKDPKKVEAKFKEEKKEQEAKARNEKENQEAEDKKQKELQVANAKNEKDEQEAKINMDQEGFETNLKEKKEDLAEAQDKKEKQEVESYKEKEQREAKAKKAKEEQEAKINKDQEGLETKLKEEKEDLEAQDKKEKEEQDAKVKEDPIMVEAKFKEEKKEQEAKARNEKENPEAEDKKQKELQVANAKNEKDEQEAKVNMDQEGYETNLKEKKEDLAEAQDKKEKQEVESYKEKEQREAKAKKAKEEQEAKINKDQEGLETKLKEEKEDLVEAQDKKEKQEAESFKEKEQQEAKPYKEKEEQKAKVKKDQVNLEAKSKEEKKEQEARAKKEKGKLEVEAKKENEQKVAYANKEKEEKGANVKKGPEKLEAKLKDEKKEQETRAKKEKEKQEFEAQKEKEQQEAKAKEETEKEEAIALTGKEEREVKLTKDQEGYETNLKEKKEDLAEAQDKKEKQEVESYKEKEQREAKAKKAKEEQEAKINKDQEGLETKLKEEKEDLVEAQDKKEKQEAESFKEKEQQEAKPNKEKEEQKAKVKKDQVNLEAKSKEEKKEQEARAKKEKGKLEVEAKKENEQKVAYANKEKEEKGANVKKGPEKLEAKLKDEKKEQETRAKKEKEKQEFEAQKEKEQQEAKAKEETEKEEAIALTGKEEREVKLTKEKEEQEAHVQEINNKKKAKKDLEEVKNMKVKEEQKKEKQQAETKTVKEQQEAKAKKEDKREKVNPKKDQEEQKAMSQAEKQEQKEKDLEVREDLKKEMEKQVAKQIMEQQDTKENQEKKELDSLVQKKKEKQETKVEKEQQEAKVKEEKNEKEATVNKENKRKEENETKAKKVKEQQDTKTKKENKELDANNAKKDKKLQESQSNEAVEERKSTSDKKKEEHEVKINEINKQKAKEVLTSEVEDGASEDHYIKEYQYEPRRHENDRHKFIDHNHTDYISEFLRPANYRERTFATDKTPEIISLGKNATTYKAQSIILDSQLRSSVPPLPERNESERRERPRSKALSEARSMISERRTVLTRDSKRKPVFSTYLTDRTAVEGSRVKLTCSVLSSSSPQITWYKNGVLLDNKIKYSTKMIDGLITLEVLNAVPSDSAEYSCTANNENGSVSTSSNLKVYPSFEATPIPPTFTRSIRDIYHLAENELVLECRIRGQPLPTITWLKDDKPVNTNDRYQAYYLADGVCRLAISSPTLEDSGKYTCKAENSMWSDHITHVVNFTGKESRLSPNLATIERSRFNRHAMESRRPHFTNVLTDYQVAHGGTIGFQVEIRGSPTRVEWLREGRSVTEVYRNARTFVEQGLYTFALSDVTEKESGMYTCRACSTHGNVDMNAAITVVQPNEMEGKPAVIVGRPEKDILISVGEDINISFRVQGEPKPKVIFMKGIRDITNNQRACKMTSDDYVKFTLKRSVVSDAGTYCILARNAYGCDRAFVTVVVRQRASSENLISDWTYPMDDSALSIAERKYKSVPERIPGEPTVVDGGNNWVSLAWPKSEHQTTAPVIAFKVESWLLGKEGGARWVELGITPLNSFDVFNLKQEKEYHFRVTPRNRYGWGESVQTTTPIGIGLAGDRPEFVDILPGQLKVLAGETANLSCSVKGKPLPEVVWMKNGHEIEEEARMTTLFNGHDCSLIIKDINREDEGRYSCEASNVHGRASTYARLAVVTDRLIWEADAKLKRERSADAEGEFPPQFTMRLRDRRVQATYPVRLTCQVIGRPSPALTWYRDGEEITFDGRRNKYQDEHFHTLEIAPTTLEDGGVYEALARNSCGAVSCRCGLVVDKGIRAYVAPEFCCGLEPLYRLAEGDELRISAVVEAYPSVGVTWYRDGVRLRPSRRAVMTLDRDGQIELALASVTAREAGVYTCTASNEVGRASTSGKVEVFGGELSEKMTPPVVINTPDAPYSREPMFTRKPRSSEAREGDTVIIACEVVGDPKPDVYWLRDFLKPDYYRDAIHFKRVGEGLEYRFEIPHAKLDYTGAYSVVARNVHGEAKAIISLQILAKDPSSCDDAHNVRYGRVEVIPRFERNLTDLLSYDGDAVEFECQVSGNPEPDVRWFHYHEVIRDCPDFESTYEEGTARLKIKQVTAEDEGTYTCEASNNLGKATSSACLVVYPPGEPNTLSQRLRRPPALLSAASTPRSTPRSTPARSVSRTPGPDTRRLCSPSRQMAPSFYTYPFNKVVEEGDHVTFKCAVKGLPVPWASWDKDGVIVTPSARITMREKDELMRILEIEQVTIEDVGIYRITLENEYGRAEASARLEVISQSGKFYGGLRAYSPSPRKCLSYRRRTPSSSRQD